MLPVLLDLKYIKIYTFGVFLVLAFFWGMFLLWRNVKLTSYKEEDIFDGLFVTILGSLFFSRLLYVITHFDFFGFNILKFILINGYPGLTLYGALLGGLLTFYLYSRSKKISFSSIIDYGISPLLLSLGIGKIGSFFSGGDVGTQTQFLLSVKYVGFTGMRHITPLYEAILLFIGAYFTYRFLFLIRRTVLPKGFNLIFTAFYFPLIYLLLDKIKQNHLYFLGINLNFLLSLIFVFVFGIYFLYIFRKEILSKSARFKFKGLSYVKNNKKPNRQDKNETDTG
ncbi:MAG TPA: prolipoprotein diacylglyceryl transferase family protein [Candidatus Nitrosocosmicus sp.]|nr:prolipoprotein diacylglyceryl transferase family protein [Candidatus Nitrosocosmicus sp.]